MLELTRLNGSRFFVNGDLIQYAEAAPDTVLTLVTGEKLVVIESCEAVRERALACRAEVLRSAWPDAAAALAAYAAHLAPEAADVQVGRDPGKAAPMRSGRA